MSGGTNGGSWESSVARVLTPGGGTAGSAFAIAPGLMITCAHVLSGDGSVPDGEIEMIFPALTSRPRATGTVVADKWYASDDDGDLAVVQLATSPAGLRPLPIAVSAAGCEDDSVRSFGFPAGAPDTGRSGAAAVLRLLSHGPVAERLQFTTANDIASGFSGAPAVDRQTGFVIGMISGLSPEEAEGRATGIAYATPADRIREVVSGLAVPAEHDRVRGLLDESDEPDVAKLAGLVAADCQQRREPRASAARRFFRVRWRLKEGRRDGPGTLAEYYHQLRLGHQGDGDERKIAVLGPPGSGKTNFAVKFTEDYLALRRKGIDRVPVFFSIGSWDPDEESLQSWMADQIELRFGGFKAETLVNDNKILPVLDGFDEIDKGKQSTAMDDLFGHSYSLILTSRHSEYEQDGGLPGAIEVELASLTVDDLAGPLREASPQWEPVVEQLRGGRKSAETLAKVLETPLMAWLAAHAYDNRTKKDPGELLKKKDKFPSGEAIEAYLLSDYARTMYKHGRNRDDDNLKWARTAAPAWMEGIARHLKREGTQDLEWWRLGEMLSFRARVLAVMVVVGVVVAIVDAVVEAVVVPVAVGKLVLNLGGVVDGPLTGLLLGPLFGVLYAIMESSGRDKQAHLAVELLPLTRIFHERGHQGYGVRRHAKRGGIGLLAGFGGGAIYGFAIEMLWKVFFRFPPGPFEKAIRFAIEDALVFGGIFALAAGAGFLFISLREVPVAESRVVTPLGLLESNRVTALRQVPVLAVALTGLIIGLGFLAARLPGAVMPPAFTVDIGLVVGISGTLAYILVFTAWGQWLIMARVALPLKRRLPRELVTFLEDSHNLGILRQSGVVYQFCHMRLRDTLADPDAAE